jgi:hypothetical protein
MYAISSGVRLDPPEDIEPDVEVAVGIMLIIGSEGIGRGVHGLFAGTLEKRGDAMAEPYHFQRGWRNRPCLNPPCHRIKNPSKPMAGGETRRIINPPCSFSEA